MRTAVTGARARIKIFSGRRGGDRSFAEGRGKKLVNG